MTCLTPVRLFYMDMSYILIVPGWVFTAYQVYIVWVADPFAIGALEALRKDRRPHLVYLRPFAEEAGDGWESDGLGRGAAVTD